MNKITLQEFISSLISNDTSVSISVEIINFNRFERATREREYYCDFNFRDFKHIASLYPKLFNTTNSCTVIINRTQKLPNSWRKVYGIEDDLNYIYKLWKEISK